MSKYGQWEKKAWAEAMDAGVTSESFAIYLDEQGIQAGPSQVRRWMCAADHTPLNVGLHLARHAEQVSDVILDALGKRHAPLPEADHGRGVLLEMADVGRLASALVADAAEALADGRMCDLEIARGRRRIAEIRAQLDEAEGTLLALERQERAS